MVSCSHLRIFVTGCHRVFSPWCCHRVSEHSLLCAGPQGFRGQNTCGHWDHCVNQQGTSTAFPSGLTIAATWDVTAARLWGETMGEEFRDKGSNVQLGPGLCVSRLPQNGRNFECK